MIIAQPECAFMLYQFLIIFVLCCVVVNCPIVPSSGCPFESNSALFMYKHYICLFYFAYLFRSIGSSTQCQMGQSIIWPWPVKRWKPTRLCYAMQTAQYIDCWVIMLNHLFRQYKRELLPQTNLKCDFAPFVICILSVHTSTQYQCSSRRQQQQQPKSMLIRFNSPQYAK